MSPEEGPEESPGETGGTGTGGTGTVSPPAAEPGARRTLRTRVAVVAGVLVVAAVAVVVWLVGSTAPFSVEEPRPEQAVPAGQPVRAAGEAGDVENGSLFVLAAEPGQGGQEIFTIGDRPVVDPDEGRWDGAVTPPAASGAGPVRVVVVRADPLCGRQLDEMGAADQGARRFYGPIPEGCAVLATVPVRVEGG